MNKIYALIGLVLLINKVQGQNTDAKSQNYKHLNTPSQDYNQSDSRELTSEEMSLNNQKTHKKSHRQYIIAPTDSVQERNVQGKKTKKNYKNQFN